jgi:nucleotide-binding universal stress UspA family protein
VGGRGGTAPRRATGGGARLDLRPADSDRGAGHDPDAAGRLRAAAQAELEEALAGAFPDGTSGEIETKLAEGDAAEQLAAEATGADLLVVGSRGRSGIASVLLGSVSSHLVSHAPCPVVVVKARD